LGALADFVTRRFGVPTRPIFNPVTDTVDSTRPLVLRANPDRLAWAVYNLSPNNVYLAWSPDVSTTKGVLLDPNGGTLILLADEDGELVGYEVWGYAATASSIYVVEIEAR